MSLFPITHTTPIILPESLFIDRFNNQNLYSDINPSIYISQNGSVKILVRRVNYRKFHNKNFILYDDKSISVYAILTGAVSAYTPINIENFNYDLIKNNYYIPTYWTYQLSIY